MIKTSSLKHLKLRNREDILCFIGDSSNTHIDLINPISITMSPSDGMFAKSWLIYSATDVVSIPTNTVMFMNNANDKAIEYYDAFHTKSSKDYTDETSVDEYQEMFEAMMDSKTQTKH